jgi:oxygen-independent coproporphyrinogen-3 oxidase
VALPIELRGHDCRYAAEQALMAFLPEFGGEGDRLVSAWDGEAASALLRFRGREYEGRAERDGPLPESELLRKRALQRLVKESIFRACVSALGKTPPWGSLTGVRPGKLAARHMEETGRDENETAAWLEREYSLSPRRAALCARAAKTGLEVKDGLGEKDILLYVGIPFCPTRCAYCSFVSHSVEKSLKLVEPYVEALGREIDDAGKLARELGWRVKAVYWGGGTPTTLEPEQLQRTLDRAAAAFELPDGLEYTVEAGRPDTITREKLRVLQAAGVTRISLNPQTMDDRVLAAIGRRHSAQAVRDSYALAREHFGGQINMDLIAGLPGDSPAGFRASLEEVLAMGPENVTVHSLTRKRGADLNGMAMEGLPGETVGEMLDFALEKLPEARFAPYYLYRQKFSAGGYENVGWAKAGTVCVYNVAMMEELCTVLSLGAGGATKRLLPGGRILRCFNKKYPYEYIASLEEADRDKRALFLPPA